MGCINSSTFKYYKLNSNYKSKSLGSYKHYVFLLETINITENIEYFFIIYDKLNNVIITKLLLSLNNKPRTIVYKYNDLNNILYLRFTVKYSIRDMYIYEYIVQQLKILSNDKYNIIYYNNDYEFKFKFELTEVSY